MTDSRGCEHEGTKVEAASNRLNGVADPEGATPLVFQTSLRFLIVRQRQLELHSIVANLTLLSHLNNYRY